MGLRGKSLSMIGVSLVAIVGLFACAPVTMLNTITPSASFSKNENISYGALERHKLDIYKPATPKTDAPVLVFIHGGSWEEGDKNMYKFLAEGFTSEGYEVVVPNYRLYPDARYPDMIDDSAKAVSYVARTYSDRPVIMMGHSAGAYNSLMLAMDKDRLEKAGTDMCSRISGAVSLAGPVGIVPLKSEPLITIFPDRFTKSDAPLNNVAGPAPALLLINGQDDKSVYPQNATVLAEKVTARGGKADAKLYAEMNHTDPVRLISRHFDGGSTLKADILKFIDENSGQRDNYCY